MELKRDELHKMFGRTEKESLLTTNNFTDLFFISIFNYTFTAF
jgi:hypothetical protein